MAPRIEIEISVGLTGEISSALEAAVEFQGLKPSQFGRMAIVEKLCREGFLQRPEIVRLAHNPEKAA
jgi:hypothetical protein